MERNQNRVDEQEQEQTNWQNRAIKVTAIAGLIGSAVGIAASPAEAYVDNHNGSVTVERGDNLSTILHAETGASGPELYRDVRTVAERNHITNPNNIYVGETIQLTPPTSESSHTLRHGETIWGETKDHYGHVTPDLVKEVVEASNVNPERYFAGETLRFPAEKSDAAEWVIRDRRQTIWALSEIVSAVRDIPESEALASILQANPGIVPEKLQLEDTVKLDGVSEKQLADLFESISHLKKIQEHKPTQAKSKHGKPAVPAQTPDTLPTDPKVLAQKVLSNPNVTIERSPNNRVKKSIADIEDDGKTFTHDVASNNRNEVMVSPAVLQVIETVAEEHPVVITSLSTGEHASGSDHYKGEAIDIKTDDSIFQDIYAHRDEYKIDELISADPPDGTSNLKHGEPYHYNNKTLSNHKSHIHFSTEGKTTVEQTGAKSLEAAPPSATPETQEVVTPPYSLETDALSKSGLTVDQLNKLFEGTPMAGLGQSFLDMEAKYGINALFASMHAKIESASGSSRIAQSKHNLFGFNAYDSCPSTCSSGYEDFEQSIDIYGDFVKTNYLTEGGKYYSGGTTISNIFVHYSTSGQEEARIITEMMNSSAEKLK